MDSSGDGELARANALCRAPAFRAAIWRHCAWRSADAAIERLSTRIHPNDQMLRHSLKHFEPNRSLSQYFNVALQQHNAAQQVLRALFAAPAECDILDFACGYGRLLRFLTLSVAPARIWASDIQRDAVEFVAGEFGVHGMVSEMEPQRFEPGRKFDFVWVASLFSHLPRALFHAWLRRLLALLKPEGVLCFSVHDECILPPDVPMSGDGLLFIPNSENPDLDTNAYGTTFVSEAFVRGAVQEATAAGHPSVRIRRGLANEQDIYVVPAARGRDLSALPAFRRGPWGWVDRVEVTSAGGIELAGWAGSLDDGAIDVIEVRVDGRSHRCPTGLPRADVATVLDDGRLARSGWEFRHALGPGAAAFVEVTARSALGEMALLYAGELGAPT